MSNKSRDDQDEEFGKAWDRANKEALDGIEESGKSFQRGMGKHRNDED